MADGPPTFVGLCPGDHLGEFYVPLDAGDRAICPSCDQELVVYATAGKLGEDARGLGGDIAGPGGPHDEGQVLIDTRMSVLMDAVDVAMMDSPSDRRRFASMVLGGRVNRSRDRTQVLYLFDADGAAAIVTQLIGLAARERGAWAAEFKRLFEERMRSMP